MSKEELNNLKVKELEEICKKKNLPRYKGKKKLTKEQLIEEICEVTKEVNCLAKECTIDMTKKARYIENAKAGDIVAFKDKRGLTRSGMIKEINGNSFTIELKSGRKFYILSNEIVWLTTDENKKWPKDVLHELKESQRIIKENFEKKIAGA